MLFRISSATFSYVAWELLIRLYTQGLAKASGALKLGTLLLWISNIGAMAFEFVLFRMLVDDFFNAFSGTAELFGLIMVIAHQIACFWIMQNIVHRLLLDDQTPSEGEAISLNPETGKFFRDISEVLLAKRENFV